MKIGNSILSWNIHGMVKFCYKLRKFHLIKIDQFLMAISYQV